MIMKSIDQMEMQLRLFRILCKAVKEVRFQLSFSLSFIFRLHR